uniref:Uncharacterized protein n=1 Tax=Solanum lycopersicum TaxID=4081 RepID=A0A3Q7H702_SOLLC
MCFIAKRQYIVGDKKKLIIAIHVIYITYIFLRALKYIVFFSKSSKTRYLIHDQNFKKITFEIQIISLRQDQKEFI